MSKGGLIAAALSAGAIGVFATASSRPAVDRAREGADPEPAGRVVPAIEAAFELESYRPGELARLVIENSTKRLTLQVLRSGPERVATRTDLETSASPPGVQLVAEIPRLFGPGLSAQMTYYETPASARVFAAGAFHLTRAVTADPVVWRILENLWMRLARDD